MEGEAMDENTPREPLGFAFTTAATETFDMLPKGTDVQVAWVHINMGMMTNLNEYARSAEQLKPLKENLFVYKHPNPPIEVTYKIDREKHQIIYKHFAFARKRIDTLYVCYSPKDEEYWCKLKNHLAILDDQGRIKEWYDDRIGTPDIMASAKAVLLMITQNLLASKLGREDLPALLKRVEEEKTKEEQEKLKILWFIVSDAAVEVYLPGLEEYKPVYDGEPIAKLDESEREKACVEILMAIMEVL